MQSALFSSNGKDPWAHTHQESLEEQQLGARTLPLPLNHMCFNPDSVYSRTVKKTEQENALARKKGLLNVLILANVY
jgi:hypothetical protein